MADLQIRGARLNPATEVDQHRGVLGYVQLELASGLLLDGLVLRRSRDGRRYLSYPARVGVGGERHYLVRPADERARQAWERAVFRAIGVESCP